MFYIWVLNNYNIYDFKSQCIIRVLKEAFMDKFFEIVTLICFYIALFIVSVRFVKQKSVNLRIAGLTVIVMGLLLGIIGKVIAKSTDRTAILCVMVICLLFAETAFLLQKFNEEKRGEQQ